MAKPKPARTGPSLGQEVIALAILGSGILLLLALFSFDPRDLSFYSQPPQNPKANLVGPAGAYLGGILFLNLMEVSTELGLEFPRLYLHRTNLVIIISLIKTIPCIN